MSDDKVLAHAPQPPNVKADANSAMIIDSSEGSDQNRTTAAVIRNKKGRTRRNGDSRASRNSHDRLNSKMANNGQATVQEVVEAQMVNADKSRSEKQIESGPK